MERLLFWRDDDGHVTDTSGEQLGSAPRRRRIGRFRSHDLRRVGLTYTALAGPAIRELQAVAGHTADNTGCGRCQEVASDPIWTT